MKDEPRVALKPGHDLGMLVSAVVIEDHVDDLARRHFGLDGVEEADELLVPMALHAAPDHLAFQDVEGGKQRRRAVPFVVMGDRPAASLLQRQPRLGAVEGLDLALFVHRQHDGMGGRIDVETDDIAQLSDELGVGGELEVAYPVRTELVSLPNPLHRADADPDHLGHRRRRPVRRLSGRFGGGQLDHPLDNGTRQRRDARGSGLVAQKSTHAFVHEPLLPAPDAGLALARPPHDLSGAKTIAGQQDDPSPPDVLLRAAPVRNNRLKTSTLGGTNVHMDTVSHSKRLAHRASHGNLLLELIH